MCCLISVLLVQALTKTQNHKPETPVQCILCCYYSNINCSLFPDSVVCQHLKIVIINDLQRNSGILLVIYQQALFEHLLVSLLRSHANDNVIKIFQLNKTNTAATYLFKVIYPL